MENRNNLPSASQMYRLANCPGSFSLIRQLDSEGKLRQEPSVDATIGQRIHAALEGEPEYLNYSEQEIKDDCDSLATKCRHQFFKEYAGTPAVKSYYEERLYYSVSDTAYFTGQPDLTCVGPERVALVINYKTGRRAATDSANNLQLRTEVVLVALTYGCNRVGAAVVQPLVTREPEIVIYGESDLRRAEEDIIRIIDRALWSEARNAGEWCLHCPARAYCPQAHQYALAPVVPIEGRELKLPEGDDGALLLSQVETGYSILDAIWDNYKQIVTEKIGIIPGWHISEGREIRYISDPEWAEAIAEAPKNALVERSLGIGKLEEWMQKKWPKLKGQAFDRAFAKHFIEVIKTKQTKGSLERIPKRLLK